MLPTPSTSHVNYNHIYEPAEDSYLLLDTLSSKSETDFLKSHFSLDTASPLVLEIGTGSGVVLAFIAANANHIFGRSDVLTTGTDVNRFACLATQQTVQISLKEISDGDGKCGIFLGSSVGDLTAGIKPGSIDVLVFNPPYVPSESLPPVRDDFNDNAMQNSQDIFDRDSGLLSLSTDGGVDGMETTNRLLSQLESVLSERGVAYILLCAQNKPAAIMAQVRAWSASSECSPSCQWAAEKVGTSGKTAGWERLCIIRVWRREAQT